MLSQPQHQGRLCYYFRPVALQWPCVDKMPARAQAGRMLHLTHPPASRYCMRCWCRCAMASRQNSQLHVCKSACGSFWQVKNQMPCLNCRTGHCSPAQFVCTASTSCTASIRSSIALFCSYASSSHCSHRLHCVYMPCQQPVSIADVLKPLFGLPRLASSDCLKNLSSTGQGLCK